MVWVHSSPTIPEAASSRPSLKDTLILRGGEFDWSKQRGGGMSTLGSEACLQPIGPGPGRGRGSVERAGELGHRKIPGLHLIGFAVQQKQTVGGQKTRGTPQGHKGTAMRKVGEKTTKKHVKKKG